MSNIVIRGLNATLKFVTRGFVQAPISGEKVKFCRVWTTPYVCQKIKTSNHVDMKVSTS
jgi:hypothetical protein